LEDAINSVHAGDGMPKDFDHYCFEIALEALYGRSIWSWWNNHV
jgi:hypothetical protein